MGIIVIPRNYTIFISQICLTIKPLNKGYIRESNSVLDKQWERLKNQTKVWGEFKYEAIININYKCHQLTLSNKGISCT